MITIEILDAAIAEVEARKSQAAADHQALQQQMVELNGRGIALEKAMLGCDGELKALVTLREAANG